MNQKNQQWLDEFKIAIIELDEKKIDLMLDSMPSFDDLEHMQIALALIAQAKESLKKEAQLIKEGMIKIKKNRAFLEPYIKEKRILDMSY